MYAPRAVISRRRTFCSVSRDAVSVAIGPRTFRPSIYGKVATGTYIITCVVVMWFNYLGRTSLLVDIGVWASLALTLLSGFHYVAHVRRIINEPPPSS